MFSDPVEIKKSVEYEKECEKMSEADKLFKELGYEKEIHTKSEPLHNWVSITYSTSEIFIEFNGFNRAIIIGLQDEEDSGDIILTTQELKAINAKVKELGWE